MSRRRVRTILSFLLVLLGVGIIAFTGVQTVVDRRLSDSLAVGSEMQRSATVGTWRWFVGVGTLTAGLALVGATSKRP